MSAAISKPSCSLMGCTAAYVCEAAHAFVLAKSFLDAHPEAQFTILFIDAPRNSITSEHAHLLYLADLKHDEMPIRRLPMFCNSKELRAVVTPVLLLTLLRKGAEFVAYFGEKTRVFRRIPDVLAPTLADATLIATKRIQNGFGDSGRSFVGARRGSERALSAWSQKLTEAIARRRADDDDLSPCLAEKFDSVPHQQIAIPGLALNYSNVDPAALTRTEGDYQHAGQAILSFDFRGYDADKPYLLSSYQGPQPRILFSEYPIVASFCDEYREEVLAAGQTKYAPVGYDFESLPGGLRIDRRMRSLYREALLNSDATGTAEPPSPFESGGPDKFIAWLNEPLTRTRKPVTRYMLTVYRDREDVQKAYPDPLGENAEAFHYWYILFGQQEMNLPDALVPKSSKPRTAGSDALVPKSSRPGSAGANDQTITATPVNLAGYFRAELGIGVAARSVLSSLEAAGIPVNTISFDATQSRQLHPFSERTAPKGAADINIVCINADNLPMFAERTGPEWREGRYTIGVWFWEVEDFPRWLHHSFNYVDEIWVASEFMRQTFLKVSPKPVFKFLLPVQTPEITGSLTRSDLYLPDAFIFLFSFDFFSVLERKNPVGLIEAFSRAFRPGEGPVLVIKSINGDKRIVEMEKLKYAKRGRPDIILQDGYLSTIENDTLMALADCYVSLHRSEGFGLTIAEAMALGKPAIATAYSGNLEFMTPENSYLCPVRRCKVGPEQAPYPAESFWSEPDIDAAAVLLRQVYENPEEARARGHRAAEEIREVHSAVKAGAIIRDRITEIRRRRHALAVLGK